MKATLSRFHSRSAAFVTAILAVLAGAALCQGADDGPGLRYYYPVPQAAPPQVIEADVCVYGGTPGGMATAVQAARMGKKAVLVVFRRHVGGMTSGGLTATDVGNRGAIGGLAQEFYRPRRQAKRLPALRGGKGVSRALLKEAGVPVYFEHRLKDVTKDGTRITALRTENGNTFQAKVFVDATYEGDLLAAAGVSFHVGREGNAKYGETTTASASATPTTSPSTSIPIGTRASRTAGCCGASVRRRPASGGRATRKCRPTTSACG